MKTPNKISAPTTAPTTVAALLLMLVPLPGLHGRAKSLTATARSKRVSHARYTSPYSCATWKTVQQENGRNTHRLRYESTSPTAGTRRPSSSHTLASRRSRNVAARPSGCITAWPVRSSSSRRFTNMPPSRSASPSGRAATTISSAAAATPITPPCGRSPTNGCGFCFAAGRTEPHTTTPGISTRYADTGRHSSKIWLDGTTQMSMPPTPILAMTS